MPVRHHANGCLCQAGVDRNEPVAVESYSNLYQSIAQQLSQEWFGMLSGDAVPRGAIRYLCLLAVHCTTLETAVLRCRDSKAPVHSTDRSKNGRV